MIDRYQNSVIAGIWKDEEKLWAWQQVELAVIEARVSLGIIPAEILSEMRIILELNPVEIGWWKARERDTKHDLQAWIDERVRHLPVGLRKYFHEGMTSYDTEETAMLLLIKKSCIEVFKECFALEEALKSLAIKYRYCPMMGVTHGQHGEIQTFGKRSLTWYQEIVTAENKIGKEDRLLCQSRLSGAMGNYGGVTPEIEYKALEILGFKPFYGATQILPRQLHASLAQSLAALVSVISKIGTDIRLGARSPRPIYQEPFGKSQTGSSRMPQKKNTISSEQLEGLERISLGYLVMIMQNIRTWEERAIEQSSVERIAWPDIFHIVMRSLTVCTKLIEGLQVYPDNMILDIIDTGGTWAAGSAKEFLREILAPSGITTDEAYRIVQLASFIALSPEIWAEEVRKNPPQSLAQADEMIKREPYSDGLISIEVVIRIADLTVVPELGVTQEQIDKWNSALTSVSEDKWKEWESIFSIQKRLRDEEILFKQILGI